ncbi:MAG TPA: RAMP superfamily CRISPR-associated protein [Thermodesulfovibrionales bacterium]|nr:RAMP superfamily CRISPR-associated protein [Thermodesulfovibrionales bacterium]
MIIYGRLYAESPIYRGNARKTIFTRDGDGTQRLVSLAGEVAGTAQSLMDAFIGKSRNGKNIGLINRLWLRLYGTPMPETLFNKVDCRLVEGSYNKGRFFDLRMGIRLDEDRWAIETNANYKMETLFRNSTFDFSMNITDNVLEAVDNKEKLYYILEELKQGRFWFGAGKSKGLGRCRLDADIPFSPSRLPTPLSQDANHLTISLSFDTENPVLVGWNWGKLDPEAPAFISVEGRLLLESLTNIPEPIYKRLEMAIGGPILNPDDWKKKLSLNIPNAITAFLIECSTQSQEIWLLPSQEVVKLGKGKHPISKKILDKIEQIIDKPFMSREEAEKTFQEILGSEKEAKKNRRIIDAFTQTKKTIKSLNKDEWLKIAHDLGLNPELFDVIEKAIEDQSSLINILTQECKKIMPRLYQQLDRQIKLLQSDSWVDAEIENRKEHMRIKMMLIEKKITERQWGDMMAVPKGIRDVVWREFLDSHRQIQYRHILNPPNLKKSIRNDMATIDLLNGYRSVTRQELAQASNTDFRSGGPFNREVSKKYGKPYDTVFMRMLSWAPSSQKEGMWEIYIPGSTIKGAFRKRASQILKTLWGESKKTIEMLDTLFGTQRRSGIVFFSDAYLRDRTIPDQAWCSMDGVRMDPYTGKPVEEAKADFLYAYGNDLVFNMRIDLQDISKKDKEAVSLLSHLIQDFEGGDIPLGGEKTCGFGWVKGVITEINWLTTAPEGISESLFGKRQLERKGLWHCLNLKGNDGAASVRELDKSMVLKKTTTSTTPQRALEGFISHRAFGGYCGTMVVEAEVLTPFHVKESGEPSYIKTLDGSPVNGWDFFSLSSPEAGLRRSERTYAIPSKTIKGMIRTIYTITSDSKQDSPDISRLNPVDSLFGWVGRGPNQAIMGRLSVSFGLFNAPELAWFKVPYPYGQWHFKDNQWKESPQSVGASIVRIAKKWRLFPHAPVAPCVKKIDDFSLADTVQAEYMKAIMPKARCTFTVRFWNLEKEELERLIWCLQLEKELAHKVGRHRYLGFGSLRLRIMPESFLIDWNSRYSQKEEAWKITLSPDTWHNPRVISYYNDLKESLNAE